ncbi:T9SS type A sorting domain-containing protein [Chryseobacterium aahli]|uniref:T9SS type A sorting domain-containing protein n=1 Tax=Chryseobacterium aahli TaxID=1278643 RepID=UPI001F601EFC|nr:T9SS type A sorting domain-containing protein [Chryseobacterium aahli]MCI3935978.1 T9SS type A sorting domain-containing protein [Chryseobacterium aahli]
MKKFFLIMLLCLYSLGYSQGENDNWYFGKLAAVNFSTSAPVVINTSQMVTGQYFVETCGTVSDSSGKLLFYTDGANVWNRNNQIMDNGSGLSGHQSTQQLVIVKSLSNSNQYYIFIGGEYSFGNYIKYSIVDMSLGGLDSFGIPLGRVLDTQKNILVTDNNGNGFLSEAITVVPGSNGSMWLLIPNDQSLYSYNISNQGFSNGNPVVSALNFPFSLNSQVYGVKASPKLSSNNNFSHYLCISAWSGSPDYMNKVYSFNYNTGKITSDFVLQINSISSYSPEFNADASILYLGRENLYAVDLLSATPSNINYMQIASLDFLCGTIQRNKYGDIYVSIINSQYLSKILNPNVYGSGISLDINNIFLGVHNSGVNMIAGAGLPQLIEKPIYEIINNCTPDIVLDSPELHNNYTYQANNSIVTTNNYTISSPKNITMKAGNSITLLPNTNIMNGSTYLAFIEGCEITEESSTGKNRIFPKISLSIDLDKKIKSSVKIYPNPSSEVLNIKTDSKINKVSLVDATGRKVNVKLEDNKIDVRVLPAGIYLISVETKDGISTEKFIKK